MKQKYNEMYNTGQFSWFSQGYEERLTILQTGWPWAGLKVLEIGCGEGDLAAMMQASGADILGIDYSNEAIQKLSAKYPALNSAEMNYKDACIPNHDRIVMQGVLEHLDNPFEELKWMMDSFLKKDGDILASSPNFINPRGIVWMTLNLLFNVPMSLTDLHFLHPEQFIEFAEENNLAIIAHSCDMDWGWGEDMIRDFKNRLPNALSDARMDTANIPKLLKWLEKNIAVMRPAGGLEGATIIYHMYKNSEK